MTLAETRFATGSTATGPDDLIKGQANDDLLVGGPGDDRIRDLRGRNRISCGPGLDRVVTNKQSEVAANCEQVTRR